MNFKILITLFFISYDLYADSLSFNQYLTTTPPASGTSSSQEYDIAVTSGLYRGVAPSDGGGYLFTIQEPQSNSATLRLFGDDRFGSIVNGLLNFRYVRSLTLSTGGVSKFKWATAMSISTGRIFNFDTRPVLLIAIGKDPGNSFSVGKILSSTIYGAETGSPDPDTFKESTTSFSNGFDDVKDMVVVLTTANAGLIFAASASEGAIGRAQHLDDNVSQLPVYFASTGEGGPFVNPRMIDTMPKPTSTDASSRKLAVVSNNRLTVYSYNFDGSFIFDSNIAAQTLSDRYCLQGINGVSMTSDPNVIYISAISPGGFGWPSPGGALWRLTRDNSAAPWRCSSFYKHSTWNTTLLSPLLSNHSPDPDETLIVTVNGPSTTNGSNRLMLVEWMGSGFSVRSEFVNGPSPILNGPSKALFNINRIWVGNSGSIPGANLGFSTYRYYNEFKNGFE